MPSDLTVRLQSNIAAVDAEIDRIAKNAQVEIARLKERRQLLQLASKALTPELEVLVNKLKAEGLI